MQLSVIVLAAGKGTRMASNLPKTMHKLAGIPLLERVTRTAKKLNPQQIYVAYGNCHGILCNYFQHLEVTWVLQSEQLGTGHAVMKALPNINPNNQVLVLYGDVPLLSATTLEELLSSTPLGGVGILTAEVKDPSGLGRILRNKNGDILEIIEHKDASDLELQINEINTGVITCSAKLLQQWLVCLKPHNQQGEYYLTDIIKLARQQNIPIHPVKSESEIEVQGINDLWQLAQLERELQLQHAKHLALLGVRIIDPARLDLRGFDIQIQQDTEIDINVILEGPLTIGKNCNIGANCIIKDSIIGDHVNIMPNSVIEGAHIKDHCAVGPFARIRAKTVLEPKSKIGNFVEIKKSHLGEGTKANHLAYLGDAKIGANVNIGAGTITCNYDGANKWETVIKDGAFIGSNTSLVAPVIIGKNATIGAGSTINHNAPDFQLTLARAQQKSIQHWQRPVKKTS